MNLSSAVCAFLCLSDLLQFFWIFCVLLFCRLSHFCLSLLLTRPQSPKESWTGRVDAEKGAALWQNLTSCYSASSSFTPNFANPSRDSSGTDGDPVVPPQTVHRGSMVVPDTKNTSRRAEKCALEHSSPSLLGGLVLADLLYCVFSKLD